MPKSNARNINAALKREGIDGCVRQGRGYVYFYGNAFDSLYTSSVPVCWMCHMTVPEWVEEAKYLIKTQQPASHY